MQGDMLLEVNGQNVRDRNQKDVADMLNALDGQIVLLLGRVPSLAAAIQDWSRKRTQIHWRTRTSTWSAYGGANKDKVQSQRPSLPVGKEQPMFHSHSPDRESRPHSPLQPHPLSIMSHDANSSSAVLDAMNATMSAAECATATATALVSRWSRNSELFEGVQLTNTPTTGSSSSLRPSARALQISLLSQRLQQLIQAEAAEQQQQKSSSGSGQQSVVTTSGRVGISGSSDSMRTSVAANRPVMMSGSSSPTWTGATSSKQLLSRSSSVRSASRLSIVVEDSNLTSTTDDVNMCGSFDWASGALLARDARALRHLSADNLDRLLTGDWPRPLLLPDTWVPGTGGSPTAAMMAAASCNDNRVHSVAIELNASKKDGKSSFKRSFLHRRSHSSKVKGKYSKRQLPSIQVTEF